ncbi:WD40/YVTN/BNR-like repeat-containing protein [Sphaerotilus sulfidivorans]
MLTTNDSAEVVVTLPSTSNVGDIVRVTGVGAGGWRIAQNAGQSILTRNLPGVYRAAGIDWAARITSVGFSDVAGSSDGLRLAATTSAGVYTSTDGGLSWSLQVGSPRDGVSIAASADGLKLVLIAGGKIYTSADAGANWTERDSVRNWTDVASSSDGSRLVATVDNTGSGLIYVSIDSGVTWATSGAPNIGWKSVASSADGLRLVAAASAIYTSTDGGTNWNHSASLQVFTVDSSSNGFVLAAVSHDSLANEGLFVSLDAGSTWSKRRSSTAFDRSGGGWRPVKVSGDGKTIVASGGGHMHVSRDAGRIWTSSSHEYLGNVRGLAVSRDGSRMTAAVNGGSTFGLFTSADAGIATTTGISGYLTGGQHDSVELQHLGGGTFIVSSYSLFSAGGFTGQ